jgi:SAM-dependent methyltransferase
MFRHGRRFGSSMTTTSTTRTATGTMGRRSWSFLSFLGGGGGGGEADQANDRRMLHEENRKQVRLVDDAQYRMSTQHAHPLGPWRAMSVAVRSHNDAWSKSRDSAAAAAAAAAAAGGGGSAATAAGGCPPPPYRVLDLACGPRGEPGTTIARLLPLAAVLCTDSSAEFVASVPVFGVRPPPPAADGDGDDDDGDDDDGGDGARRDRRDADDAAAPPNLTTSVLDMSDLAAHPCGSFDAVVCCYGIGLAPDAHVALSEAHRVLVPGGVLVVATWERSDLLSVGLDVLGTVRGGGGWGRPSSSPGGGGGGGGDDLDAFLPPRFPPAPAIALSGPGVFESLLVGAGFDHPGAVVSADGTYPLDLGGHPDDVLTAGTMLVRGELEALGAFAASSDVGGGWSSPAEEAFWISIRKYADVVVGGEGGGSVLLRGNTFKITVSTKQRRHHRRLQSRPEEDAPAAP